MTDPCQGSMIDGTIATYPQLQRLVRIHDIERTVALNRLEISRLAQEVEALTDPAAIARVAHQSTEDAAAILSRLAEQQQAALLSACRSIAH